MQNAWQPRKTANVVNVRYRSTMGTNRIAVKKFEQLRMVRRAWLPEAKQNQRRSVCVCGSLGWALWTQRVGSYFDSDLACLLSSSEARKSCGAEKKDARNTNRLGPIDSLVLTAGKMWIPLDHLPEDDACNFGSFKSLKFEQNFLGDCIVSPRPEDPGRESWYQNEIAELQQVFISIYIIIYIWYILALARNKMQPTNPNAHMYDNGTDPETRR